MNQTVRPLLIAAGIAGVLAAGQGQAQMRAATGNDSWGTYVGAGVGDSDFDTTLKVFGGQQFHANLAWEAQFVNYGERRDRRVGDPFEQSAWSAGGSLLGLVPLTPEFSVFGKLGLHYVKVRAKAAGVSRSDSDIDIGLGLGGRFRINNQFSVRLEFEDVGDAGDLVSASVQYRF